MEATFSPIYRSRYFQFSRSHDPQPHLNSHGPQRHFALVPYNASTSMNRKLSLASPPYASPIPAHQSDVASAGDRGAYDNQGLPHKTWKHWCSWVHESTRGFLPHVCSTSCKLFFYYTKEVDGSRANAAEEVTVASDWRWHPFFARMNRPSPANIACYIHVVLLHP